MIGVRIGVEIKYINGKKGIIMTTEQKKAILENRIKVITERGKATPNLIKKLERQLRNM